MKRSTKDAFLSVLEALVCVAMVTVALDFFGGNPNALPTWVTGIIISLFALRALLGTITYFALWYGARKGWDEKELDGLRDIL